MSSAKYITITQMLPIAAVVISYHRPQMVSACLGKLLALPDAPSKVWLVDNAPNDGIARLVQEQFPSVEVLTEGENLGFAAGNNLGMQAAIKAGYPFILLLNDDAEIVPGSLSQLLAIMKADKTIGAIGPVVYYGNGKEIWSAGGRINGRTGLVGHILCPPHESAAYVVDYVTACAVLYCTDAITQVGMFDERFFMYYEDSDLGVRLAEAGYRSIVGNNAAALHHVPHDLAVRMQSPGFLYYLNRNRILFVRKHNPLHIMTDALLFRGLLELAIVLGKGNWAGMVNGIKGLYDGLKGKGGRMKGAL